MLLSSRLRSQESDKRPLGSRSMGFAARQKNAANPAAFLPRHCALGAPPRRFGLAIDLEQPGAALPAADAHRHHAPFGLAAAAFLQNVAGQPRAGHAEGMANRDRAAIDVVFRRIDAELVAAIQA